MRREQLLALLGALVALACGSRPELPGRSVGADERPKPDEDAATTTAQSDSLRFEIDIPPAVPSGEPVPIVLRVRNVGDKPLELYLTGRPIAFDITITRADGTQVWRRLEGAAISAILRIEVLGPGEVLELKDAWDQRQDDGKPAGPGVYQVRGALPTEGPAPLETSPVSLLVSE